MNRENEQQRPVSQTFCGALQKEPNCKCLVLSVLIYGCLAAVTWCRCANVTKVVINYSVYPMTDTRHVSPCDDGYIYIPVAFMGMLYLVYLVECYHSPIRIDLLHAENQDSVLSKISQLKLAQPTIWWKAVSYHYVRRKRQITRYRNGDNYTTTQVYYERINTHAATSFYYYDFCGVKDISKELILDPKVPITKINLTKGFAFSNMRSATEFEEARTRFFAEQELRDDYMEMREGLDLGYNPNPTTLVAVLGNPWFTNRYVYWCLSALLLSWPLRVIVEYKTQYADYQITKLFGINYDTPSGSEPIQASMSQQTINQPGSYMLAPSYSEALLMDPAPDQPQCNTQDADVTQMVPSYSEALLYQRAEHVYTVNQDPCHRSSSRQCSCPYHDTATDVVATATASAFEKTNTRGDQGSRQERNGQPPNEMRYFYSETEPGNCGSCGRFLVEAQLENFETSRSECTMEDRGASNVARGHRNFRIGTSSCTIPRDMSEPNLGSRSELTDTDTRFLTINGQSLRNILECEEEVNVVERIGDITVASESGRRDDKFCFSACSLDEAGSRVAAKQESRASRGAIPKRTSIESRVIANPMSNERLANSKTYFCLKSILKQNNPRYTLIGARELQNVSDREYDDSERRTGRNGTSYREGSGQVCASTSLDLQQQPWSRSKESLELDGGLSKQKKQLLGNISMDKDKEEMESKRENSRTLIFASPIQEVCPGDPFEGKDVVRTRQQADCIPFSGEESSGGTVFTQLGRSLTRDRKSSRRRRYQESRRQRHSDPFHLCSSFRCPPDRRHPYSYSLSASTDAVDNVDFDDKNKRSPRVYRHGTSFPPYEGSLPVGTEKFTDQPNPVERRIVDTGNGYMPSNKPAELTRSLTERRMNPGKANSNFRRSFNGRVEDYRTENNKWANLNMETSL